MAKETKVTLRTRHIHCFYCIALSFLILAIVLFALSSEQSQVLNNQQNRIPVVISASVILLLSVVIFIWVTYYAIGYFRVKRHEKLNQSKKQENGITTTAQTSVVIFDNAAFTMDDPLAIDSSTNIQASA
jgi:uncharacterized membrane protein